MASRAASWSRRPRSARVSTCPGRLCNWWSSTNCRFRRRAIHWFRRACGASTRPGAGRSRTMRCPRPPWRSSRAPGARSGVNRTAESWCSATPGCSPWAMANACWPPCRPCGNWHRRTNSRPPCWPLPVVLAAPPALPDLPPRLLAALEAAAQEAALRVGLVHHPARVVAQRGHAQRIVGLDQDVQRLFLRRNALVVGQGQVGAADGRHIGAVQVVVARHMHLILRQRVHDIGHALACILRVARLRKAVDEFPERLEGVFGGLLVALG